jgi:hypothetical protein
VVLNDQTQIAYTGFCSVHLSCCLTTENISVTLLPPILFVSSLQNLLYSWNTIYSIVKFPMINDGVLQVVHPIDRSVVINPFQLSKDFGIYLVPSESALLADGMDYDFWHMALGHPFKGNMNRKLSKYGYSIHDGPFNFTYNPCGLSKSKHKVPKLVEWNSTEVFELIQNDDYGPFPNESDGGSKYLVTVIDDFSCFPWVFIVK